MDNIKNMQQFNLYCKLYTFFETYKELSIEQIRSLLRKDEISFCEKDLFDVLYTMYCKDGALVRNDKWTKEATFKLLDKYYWDSRYSEHYYNFDVDDHRDKDFILIADTHIGNPKLEDFSLIEEVYDYAVEKKIPKVFHLGDVFSGNTGNGISKEELLQQLNLFLNNYPDTAKDGVVTMANLGNHDEWLHGFFDQMRYTKDPVEALFDLRGLGEYNKSFFVIPRESYEIDFADKTFHFAHRLFYGTLITRLYVQDINDLKQYESLVSKDRYDVLFSAHLHKGLIYSIMGQEDEKDKLYLGVPSLSQLNKNDIVAYKIHVNYKDEAPDNLEITLLNDGGNGKIVEGEIIPWSFKEKNKKYEKIFTN